MLSRCSELEGQRLQDAERLTAVNTELSKLKDMYWTKKGEVVSSSRRKWYLSAAKSDQRSDNPKGRSAPPVGLTFVFVLYCLQDRLRHDLQMERDKRVEAEQQRRRAEASGLQLQLQNPSLSLKAMQQLLNAQDQVSKGHAGAGHTGSWAATA